MSAKIAVLEEVLPGERRVAIVPDVADHLFRLGARVSVQSGAGHAIKLPDASYKNTTWANDVAQLVAYADVVLAANSPASRVQTLSGVRNR